MCVATQFVVCSPDQGGRGFQTEVVVGQYSVVSIKYLHLAILLPRQRTIHVLYSVHNIKARAEM